MGAEGEDDLKGYDRSDKKPVRSKPTKPKTGIMKSPRNLGGRGGKGR